MITGRQIRAARGLLEWKAEDLARRAGITRETISKIESDAVQPHEKTLASILRVFDESGVEFIGNRGVAQREDLVRVLEGDNVYIRLLDEIFHKLNGKDKAEALFFFVDNSKSSSPVVDAHKRLRDHGIRCRYLCHEKPARLDFPVNDYKAIPHKFFYNAVQVVYADYVAQIIAEEPMRVIIVKSRDLAEASQRLFEMLWSMLPVPKLKKNN